MVYQSYWIAALDTPARTSGLGKPLESAATIISRQPLLNPQQNVAIVQVSGKAYHEDSDYLSGTSDNT